MLENVVIENFRCLRAVDVPLRPLTVLLGPNDSGKSAFLAALRYLSGAVSLDSFDKWRLQNVDVHVCGNGNPDQIERSSTSAPVCRHRQKVIQDRNPFLPLGYFVLPSGGVPMQSAGYADAGNPPELGENGAQCPALVDHLLRRDRKRFDEFVQALCALIDGVEEVQIGTPDGGSRRIELTIDGGFQLPANNASVGVRLMLFFLSLAYHPSPPKLILIEEPENGVHPKRLGDVIRLLREITQGVHGKHAAQVVLTTHSPHLVDCIDPETDQVLVFRREDDGSRTAQPADSERLKTFLDEFMLGEVWFNEGEVGLVGRPE